MIAFLIYDLKVAALVAVFYMFYRLLLSRDTWHRINRVVLLTTAVVSFVLPLCVITIHHTVVLPLPEIEVNGYVAGAMDESSPVPNNEGIGAILLFTTFFLGLVVTMSHLLWSIIQVLRLIHQSEQHRQADGTVICVTDKEVSPFSWMCYIVLNRQDYESPDLAIMAHERGHIRLRHSFDVLLVDTLTVLQWFNPAMWMLRQDLRAIHEYEADAAVLSQGINMRQYQYLLIQKAVATCGYSVVNGISHSTLKNRITMMLTNKKTNHMSWLKLLAMLPILGTTLVLNAETVDDYVYEEKPQAPVKPVVKKGKKNAQIKMGAKTIEVKTTESKISEQQRLKPIQIGNGAIPLIVINGKVSTKEQMENIGEDEIDHVNVIKNEEALKEYARYFNEDTSKGIIFINTKEFVEKGKKELAAITVVAKGPQVEDTEKPEQPELDMVFDVVEQMPMFPGGMEEMMKFISMNVRYPKSAMEKGQQGRVLVQFIIERDGSLSNVQVVKKVNEDLDAEALRIIGQMPKWNPGMQNGQTVRVKFTIPISFRLN